MLVQSWSHNAQRLFSSLLATSAGAQQLAAIQNLANASSQEFSPQLAAAAAAVAQCGNVPLQQQVGGYSIAIMGMAGGGMNGSGFGGMPLGGIGCAGMGGYNFGGVGTGGPSYDGRLSMEQHAALQNMVAAQSNFPSHMRPGESDGRLLAASFASLLQGQSDMLHAGGAAGMWGKR